MSSQNKKTLRSFLENWKPDQSESFKQLGIERVLESGGLGKRNSAGEIAL